MLVCGVLPVLTLVSMFVVGATGGSFADDFHHEIYPRPRSCSMDGIRTVAGLGSHGRPELHLAADGGVRPRAADAAAAGAADVVMIVLGLVLRRRALAGRRRDWRVYGVIGLCPRSPVRCASRT